MMTTSAIQLLSQALGLSVQERGAIAARLIESLDPERDSDAEAAWELEIRERLEEVKSGRVTPVPLDEALRQIMEDGDVDES